MGPEVIKALVIPKIKAISERLEVCLEGPTLISMDKNGAGHIKTLLVVSARHFSNNISVLLRNYKGYNFLQKSVAPVLKTLRSPPDFVDDYKQDYGYIGPSLCSAVTKARTQPCTTTTTTLTTPGQQQTKTIVQTGTQH